MSDASRPPTVRRAWLMPLARRYVDFRLRRAFDAVLVAGLAQAREAAAAGPVLIAANHVAWWDPLVATALDARLGCEGYALMDAESLARLWFFGAIGALPLRRGRGRDARADLASAATQLTGAGRALWIFPQGRQRPAHLRPLGLGSGVSWLARHTRAATVPLSVSYLYREAPQPAIFATFGAPLTYSSHRTFLEQLESELVRGLDHNDAGQAGSSDQFAALWPASRKSSIPLGGRLLARDGHRGGAA